MLHYDLWVAFNYPTIVIYHIYLVGIMCISINKNLVALACLTGEGGRVSREQLNSRQEKSAAISGI